ncbi:stress response rci peptide [Ophiostoma piceae UAMH 11346]|uniref:Stress response rci peptide n=1 Tax=Ophiostoma piceae (strain UAMH 11346) TaxID=1262450 RepID=S3BZQ8_OPHP1|nr:stress response rci peptide [Ophiostoma piceae UAMH 11346]
MCSTDIFLGLLALVFPPVAVWVKRGICSADSVINILLCVLGYIPGLIHAWYIIAKFPEPDYDYEVLNQDAEGGRVTYYVVQPGQPSHSHSHSQNGSRRAQGASSSHHITTTSVAGDSNVPSPIVAPAAPKIQENMNYGTASPVASPPASSAAGPSTGDDDAGEGRSDGPPPSYAQTVAGDNKIQNQD